MSILMHNFHTLYTCKCNDGAIFGSLLNESFSFGKYKNKHEGSSAAQYMELTEANA